jgi:hypothetical protein
MATPKQIIKRSGSHKTATAPVMPTMTPLDDDKIAVRTDIPIRMHPDSLLGIAKPLDEENTIGQSVLSAAREALKICHEAYGRMNDAEAALRKASPSNACRPAGDDDVRLLKGTPAVGVDHETFVNAAEQAYSRIAPQVERRVRELEGIKETLSELVASALDDPARKTPEGLTLAAEVRSHIKGLSDKIRMRFVIDAIEASDKATVAAVLHAQPFLSGLDSAALGMLRERAASKFAPVDSAQLGATTAAIKHVTNAVSLLFGRYTRLLSSRKVC